MKYIFVTGGVVSSLGKGIAAASLGTLLEHRGLKVTMQKLDPYLNVDPGTMNPFEHGEVYVLDDGAETDLDLGHYERFTNCVLTRRNNSTSGQIYESIIAKERAGDFLGKTVQVIPHVTDEIKARIRALAEAQPCDVLITEIGGTVGDIEGLPFLEAIRQFLFEVGPQNAMIMHVTLVPFISAAGELKTKPSQQSIAKLREIGLNPDVLIARAERPIGDDVRKKLSVFCNVPLNAVIEGRDVESTIYEVPLLLQQEKLDDIVCARLGLNVPPADMSDWERFVKRLVNPKKRVRIAMVGKYLEHKDAYKSIDESVHHAAASLDCGIEVVDVDAELLETQDPARHLHDVAGVLVPGGFGERGIEGTIRAAEYARTHGVPYLGLCLGMQIATIEFARNVLGLAKANSTEFDPKSPHPVIDLLPDQKKVKGKGATMRLGTWPLLIREGTRAHQLYGPGELRERHRPRYEFNQAYRAQMEAAGFIIA
ncbi:MAG: CTP synthase, partial [Chthoniobacteraceae bacterium]